MSLNLTPREFEVAELIHFGATEKEISQYLDIAIDTVKSHKRSLFIKTGSRNIADVTRWYAFKHSGISIKPSELARRVIPIAMLAIVLFIELAHSDFLRPRRQRARNLREIEVRPRRIRSVRKTFIYA